MAKRNVMAGTAAGRRSPLAQFLNLLSPGASAPAPANSGAIMEALESRVLLSAAHVAKPDFLLYHPFGTSRPADTTSPTGLSPSTILQAYGFNQVAFGSVAGDGTGQTIAIVDAYNAPNIVGDLQAFDQQFNLPAATLIRIGQDGSSTLPGTDPAGRGDSWALETSLDVEWAHAVAPKATILLVEARSDSDTDLFAAINTARHYSGVSVVSMSWGGGETSNQSTYDSYFTTPSGHTGITFVASSGDSGAYDPNSYTRGVEYPAASPNVLAVGGTYLSTTSSGAYLSESGWGYGTSSGISGGSGGGISRYVSQPSYQRGVVTQSSSYRAVPDVALDADPRSGVSVYDSWDFATAPWIQLGGTSMAAPIWAGIIAIADQGRAISGTSTLDGATQTLPAIYALPSQDFHDITSGNNGYAAGTGYDLVTGRGTPLVNLLIPALAGTTPTTPTPPVPPVSAAPTIGSFVVNPSSLTVGATATLTAGNVQETGGTVSRVTFYRESDGISGLQVGSDTLIGYGTQNGSTWSLSGTTSALSPGVYTYYAVASDAASVSSSAALATLTVTSAPVTPPVTPPTSSAPANDNFANAIVLTGTSTAVAGSNAGATKEAGEPNHAGNVGGRSVWYVWTAPASGSVTLDTHGSNFDTLLAVYTGSAVSRLALVASNDDDALNRTVTSALTFNAVAGTTYRIAIDGYQGAYGTLALNLSQIIAPPNDNFANGKVMTGVSASAAGTNVGATREAGEPYHAGNIGGKSVWYTWTAPSSGRVSLNTHGSNFDTVLAAYVGSAVSSLSLVASNDDDVANGTVTSALTFNAVAGTTYHFAVDGFRGATGNVVLSLSEVAAPANDNVNNAAVLTGDALTWLGSNVGATREFGEPRIAGNAGGASIWFSWTATSSRTVNLSTLGSNFDTLLAVYAQNSPSTLTYLAGNDDAATGVSTSALTFDAVAGTTYYFTIDGFNGTTGNITLNLS